MPIALFMDVLVTRHQISCDLLEVTANATFHLCDLLSISILSLQHTVPFSINRMRSRMLVNEAPSFLVIVLFSPALFPFSYSAFFLLASCVLFFS